MVTQQEANDKAKQCVLKYDVKGAKAIVGWEMKSFPTPTALISSMSSVSSNTATPSMNFLSGEWTADGKKDSVDVAHEIVVDILANHEVKPLFSATACSEQWADEIGADVYTETSSDIAPKMIAALDG